LPEWWIERGIGETRYALIDGGEIVEARIELDGIVRAGAVLAARLVHAGNNGRNAVARDAEGREYLLPRGCGGASEGAAMDIEVTREEIPGGEPWKRPLARMADVAPRDPRALNSRELSLPHARDEFGAAGWNDLIDQARTGTVSFSGGDLRLSATPAMTLIDVDGYLPPDDLALLGAAEAANAIRRLDVGGSIGIDLPSNTGKPARQRAAAAIDAHLPQPFERTAVNGFGFVQIVRPRRRASVIELAQDRAAFEARALLRRLAFEPPGPKTLVAHPAVAKQLLDNPRWLEMLARQVGGTVQLRADTAIPMSGAYAEKP
jgi:hypothetical protein